MALHVAVILVGFMIVNCLPILIAQRIRRHMGNKFSGLTFLFVSIIAFYYLIDALLSDDRFYGNLYIYLWLAIFVIQLILFFNSRRNLQRSSVE